MKLAKPMEDLGFTLISYYPNLRFLCPETKDTFSLPVPTVKRINRAIAAAKPKKP